MHLLSLIYDHLADELLLLRREWLARLLRPLLARGVASAGGNWMDCPASIRSPGVARLPFTRSCPVRDQREMMLKLTSGLAA